MWERLDQSILKWFGHVKESAFRRICGRWGEGSGRKGRPKMRRTKKGKSLLSLLMIQFSPKGEK